MIALVAAATLLAGAPPPVIAPVDTATRVNGVEVACTGIGRAARSDPRWQSYGVRVEFSNARNEYLVGGVVSVRDASGRTLLRTSCDAPWLLLRLAPGRYVVEATMDGAAARRSARITAPASGQLRVVLQFADQ